MMTVGELAGEINRLIATGEVDADSAIEISSEAFKFVSNNIADVYADTYITASADKSNKILVLDIEE